MLHFAKNTILQDNVILQDNIILQNEDTYRNDYSEWLFVLYHNIVDPFTIKKLKHLNSSLHGF